MSQVCFMNKLMTYIELANPKLRKEKCAIIIMSLFGMQLVAFTNNLSNRRRNSIVNNWIAFI